MAEFPENVVRRAWLRANGRCEYRRKTHRHKYVRCNKQLVWGNRGRVGRGCWEAHHISFSGGNGLSNCQILCWACHSRTL